MSHLLLARGSSSTQAEEMELDEIIESNAPPNDSQAREMRMLIASSLSEVSQLDDEIHVAERSLSELQHRRSSHTQRVDGLKRALSSIRTIPSDILSEIFLVCRDDALDFINYSIFDAARAPLLLAHISSGWRAVCLSDTRLWDHIHVQQGARLPSRTALDHIFRYAGVIPLDVRLNTTQDSSRSPRTDSRTTLFRHIIRARDRLRRIHLTVDSLDELSDLWTHRRSFPLLTSFKVLGTYRRTPGRPVGLSLFKSAPLLREFKLSLSNSPLDLQPASVTWSQLTRLTLYLHLHLNTARSVLVACTSLEDCIMHICAPAQGVETPLLAHSTPLPRLKNLRFFTFDVVDFLPLFEAVTLPGLTGLAVITIQMSPLALPNIHHRSRFLLKDLTVEINTWSADKLEPFLQLIPSLEDLTIRFDGFRPSYFDLFTLMPNEAPRIVLPKLKSLTLVANCTQDPADDEFRDDPVAADMADSFDECPDEFHRAFPCLVDVSLHLAGEPFEDDIEDRLVDASERGVFSYTRTDEY